MRRGDVSEDEVGEGGEEGNGGRRGGGGGGGDVTFFLPSDPVDLVVRLIWAWEGKKGVG